MATRKKPVNFALTQKDATPDHEAFAEYIRTTTGVDIEAGAVAIIQRAYPLYLKSPEKVAAKEAERLAREAEKAEAEAKKQARLKARLDKIENERRAVLRSMGLLDEEEESEDEDTEEEAEVVPITKAKPKVKVVLDPEPDEDEESEEEESAPWDDEDEEEF